MLIIAASYLSPKKWTIAKFTNHIHNKFYVYIRLSCKIENASGKWYSQTSIISRLGDMADKIRARLRIAKKSKVAPSRAPSRGTSRIRTMEDLNTETLNTTFKSI